MSRVVRDGRLNAKASFGVRITAVMCAGIAAGCSADPAPVRTVAGATTSATQAIAATTSAQAAAVEYVLHDVEHRPSGTWVALDKGRYGVLIDGARAISSESGVTLVPETADGGIRKVDRVPARLGGGFLFRTGSELYTSASFDGPLRGVAMIWSIASVSFGPDAALVRDDFGQRWSVDLATGARRAPAPLGVVDIAALDDGRAVAITEGGGVSVSTDSGKTWTDASAQLQGSPSDVTVQDGEIWLGDADGNRQLRLERSGVFVEMLARPSVPKATKPDPRFASGETPLSLALRAGARVGPWTAVIGAGGDVMRVDLATGAIVATFPGVLPLHMSCEAIEIPDDVALVCAERAEASVVVTNLLHGKKPRIERSFPTDGPFFAGGDGALAYGGPCGGAAVHAGDPSATSTPAGTSSTGAADPPPPVVCVRNGDGQWEPFVLDEANGAPASASSASSGKSAQASSTAAGAGTPATPAKPPIQAKDVRWIPRLGRAPVAVIASKQLASYDAAWGEIRAWQTEGQARKLVDDLRRYAAPRVGSGIVDRRWAATGSGVVQGILGDGRGVEISAEGAVKVWPFTFDGASAGGLHGFAKSRDGRAFQTLDRGRTWDEIAAPPGPKAWSFEPRDCSPLGCVLGQWLRIGWSTTPPSARPELKNAAPPPMISKTPPLEMACVATGRSESRALSVSAEHTYDRALGAARMPARFDDPTFSLGIATVGRSGVTVEIGMMSPVNLEAAPAPRAMAFGFLLVMEPSDDPKEGWWHFAVTGPSRQASAYKQDFQFVEPLVPSAPVRRTSFKLDAIAKAIQGAGVTLRDLVEAESLRLLAAAPITPAPAGKSRAAAQGDVLASLSPSVFGTLFVVGHGGGSPRAEVLFARTAGIVKSAARLPNGDLAALVVNAENAGVVLRFNASGATEVATVPARPNGDSPPNPDAIAIGPKGEIAVLRTPSGFEPPSASDPALLVLPGPRLTALAPWSAALPAGDPACTAGPDDMYRATIRTTSSWVRLAGRPVPSETPSGMTARVRWSATRLCVEAVEVPEGAQVTPSGRATEAFVIATFAPDEAGRSDIEVGSEARSSMSCAIPPR